MRAIQYTFAGIGAFFAYPFLDNKIHLYYLENEQNQFFIENSPSLKKGVFKSTPWLASGLLQAYFGSSKGSLSGDSAYCKAVEYDRELVTLPDKGTLSIDWAKGPQLPQDSKVLLITPGLTGGSESQYIRNAVLVFQERGYRVGVMHGRGISGTPLTTPQPNNLGLTNDLDFIVNLILNRYPDAPLVALGTSMGANLLLKYAGEMGKDCKLLGIAAVSTPFDIVLCSRHLRKPWPTASLPDQYLTKNITRVFRENRDFLSSFEELGVDMDMAAQATRSYEFDKLVTCKILGLRNPEQYYRKESCVNVLHSIEVPVFALSSLDDPVVTKDCIPYEEFTTNPNMILAVTNLGGHIGWFTGLWTPKRWYAYPCAEYLDNVIQKRHKN